MSALIFRCPNTQKTFRSNFRATKEDLAAIPPTASMQLRCEICKSPHMFVLAQCTVGYEG
jgi:hypothetical protein